MGGQKAKLSTYRVGFSSMRIKNAGLTLGVKEHLHSGKPITGLEAMALYGVAHLPKVVKDLRHKGWTVHLRPVAYAAAVKRVNEYAVFVPPKNLPVRDIQLIEYWMSK